MAQVTNIDRVDDCITVLWFLEVKIKVNNVQKLVQSNAMSRPKDSGKNTWY